MGTSQHGLTDSDLDLANHFYCAVVIAMIAMRMMQMSIYQVIGVIAMWDSFVSTIRAMNMIRIVSGTFMVIAIIWVFIRYFDFVLINMCFMHVMQVTIV
jgi:hypothetical protein